MNDRNWADRNVRQCIRLISRSIAAMNLFDRADRPFVAAYSCVSTWLLLLALLSTLAVGTESAWAQQAPKPKTKETKKLEFTKFDNPDSESLPPWFQAPPDRLAIMESTFEQPLVTKDEMTRLKREADKASKALRECDLSPAGRQSIAAGIRYKLARLCLIENRSKLSEIHKSIVKDLTIDDAIGAPGIKAADKAATFDFAGKELVKQIAELLTNHYLVRLHVVMILSEIDYPPGYVLLVQVLQAKDILEEPILGQPVELKICAANGLARMLQFAAPPVKDRTVIAHAVIEELAKPKTYPWYQERLVEVLRHMTVAVDAGDNGRPFVIESLLAVLKDQQRDWRVRSLVCYALGRVPIPAAINVNDLCNTIAEFTLQLANAAAAAPKVKDWKWCFFQVYLAYQPLGKDKSGKDLDMDAERRVPGGLLARFKRESQSTYQVIVPLCRALLSDKALDPQEVKNLDDYVKSNSR